MSAFDLLIWAVVLLPSILTLLSSRAPFSHRLGWALFTIIPFPLAWLVIAWLWAAGEAAGAASDSLADVGLLIFMFLGGWFVYFKFRSNYPQ